MASVIAFVALVLILFGLVHLIITFGTEPTQE